MAKVVITYEYEPDLKHYPDDVKTSADAMRFDIQMINDGEISLGEFLDLAAERNDHGHHVKIEVVE